ncbi:hypothetical protein GOP47_0014691 [Adiantum capillus-veneris]|uniref:Uncharacterized protein n=1 Tax=Adiantum capillus-veneris TaxID=13818 RepID=A0A9D4ULZ2_ADICA|nr:hypothetical protein GOP47_0014691 [Adiantum capillus-veneris]
MMMEMVKVQLCIAKVAKAVAEAAIVTASLFWMLYWLVSTEPRTNAKQLSLNVHSRFFITDGMEGFALLYQTIPFIIIAILSFLVIGLRAFLRKRTPSSSIKKKI